MKALWKSYHIRNYNFRLIVYVIILTAIGIAVIGSANEDYQAKQTMGLFLGLLVMVVVSLVDYGFLIKFGWVFYILNIVLLLMVRFVGTDSHSATRWEIGRAHV